jgi:hypothetical protein
VPLPSALVDAVRRRARFRCEYCQVYGWPPTVDQVLPRLLGGGDGPDNLSAACFPGNRLKSAHTHAEDPLTGELVPLFNPRREAWDQQFAWSADLQSERCRPGDRDAFAFPTAAIAVDSDNSSAHRLAVEAGRGPEARLPERPRNGRSEQSLCPEFANPLIPIAAAASAA